MADRKPGLFLRLLGADGATATEAESRAWLVTCPNCDFSRSVWDTGGIRYKAAGTARRMMRCPHCGKTGWHLVHKGPNFPASTGPAWPLVRLIIGMVLLILLAVAGILLLVFKLTGLI